MQKENIYLALIYLSVREYTVQKSTAADDFNEQKLPTVLVIVLFCSGSSVHTLTAQHELIDKK